jgi:hypothetical protein
VIVYDWPKIIWALLYLLFFVLLAQALRAWI